MRRGSVAGTPDDRPGEPSMGRPACGSDRAPTPRAFVARPTGTAVGAIGTDREVYPRPNMVGDDGSNGIAGDHASAPGHRVKSRSIGPIRGRAVAGKKAADGVEEALSLFPQGSSKAIERLLKRAQEKEVKAARLNVAKAMRSGPKDGQLGSRIGQRLGKELAKAVSQRGAPKRESASIRQKAPDTNGKPFHFAHSVVTKADPSAPASSRASKAGKAAAHMRYMEREKAVEATGMGSEREVRDSDGTETGSRAPETGRSREDGSWDRERGGAPGMAEARTVVAAAQGYVENPVKLANGENVLFSFGTIGATFEERVNFWTALEEAEAHPSARVQNRLIVELPHEATPQARHEIVSAFCKRFEADGVPYWAALHAPGKDNDSRNFHAHIVYSDRPAKRVLDTADGREKWDFEVVREYVKASRNRVKTRPERQNKLRAYTKRRFIPDLRKTFSDISNEVLTREDVRDAEGAPVRYDHRSYKDMGVDAVPMRSINRIVADKLKDGQITVLDSDYTRKMITAELRQAAAQRNKEVLEVIALDKALRQVVRDPKGRASNARLPRNMRVSPLAQVSKARLEAASRLIMEARHGALRVDVMERSTAAALTRVIDATDPKAVAAAGKSRDTVVRTAAPDPAMAALLHDAAEEELAATRGDAAKARRALRYKIASALTDWKEAVGPFRSAPSATMRRAIHSANAPPEADRSGAIAATRATTAITAQAQEMPSRDAVKTRDPAPARDASGGAREANDETRQVPGGTRAPGTASGAEMTKADGTTVETEKGAEARIMASGAGPSARDGASGPGGEPDQPDLAGEPASRGRATARKALEAGIEKAAELHAARLFEHMRDGGAAHRRRLAEAGPKQGRVPTIGEAIAASRGISAVLRAVKDATDDVGQRLQMLASFARQPAALSASYESEKTVTMTGPAAMPQAREPASSAPSTIPQVQRPAAEADRTAEDGGSRRDFRAGEDRAPIGVRSADPAPRQAPLSGEVAPREGGGTLETRGDAPKPTQDPGPVSSEADGKAPQIQRRAASEPFTMRVDEPVEMAALVAGAATSGCAGPASVDSADLDGAAGAAELPLSNPPQRRKTPEELEEEERRRKKRRAVLAKSKLRDRGRNR